MQPVFLAPLGRLELSLSAPEADALSTELQGQRKKFYHKDHQPHALTRGDNVANSLRKDWTSAALPRSSPSFNNWSFLWASSPQT